MTCIEAWSYSEAFMKYTSHLVLLVHAVGTGHGRKQD
jgi:hypothetical protein